MAGELRAGRGGICGLVALLEEYGGAIEADLHRYYGKDLGDYYRGTLSARKLTVLLTHLPAESAYWTDYRDSIPADELAKMEHPASHGPWSKEHMLLARIGDAAERFAWAFERVNFQGAAVVPPGPLPRPGVKDLTNVTPISEEGFQWLESLRRGHGSPAPEEV